MFFAFSIATRSALHRARIGAQIHYLARRSFRLYALRWWHAYAGRSRSQLQSEKFIMESVKINRRYKYISDAAHAEFIYPARLRFCWKPIKMRFFYLRFIRLRFICSLILLRTFRLCLYSICYRVKLAVCRMSRRIYQNRWDCRREIWRLLDEVAQPIKNVRSVWILHSFWEIMKNIAVKCESVAWAQCYPIGAS